MNERKMYFLTISSVIFLFHEILVMIRLNTLINQLYSLKNYCCLLTSFESVLVKLIVHFKVPLDSFKFYTSDILLKF